MKKKVEDFVWYKHGQIQSRLWEMMGNAIETGTLEEHYYTFLASPVLVHERAIEETFSWEYFAQLCLHGGLACVSEDDGQSAHLVGRKYNIEAFLEIFPKPHKRKRWQSEQLWAGVDYYRKGTRWNAPLVPGDPWEVRANPYKHRIGGKEYLEAYELWLSLDKILHAVSNRWPQLRDWEAKDPEREVVLKPHAEGVSLGGVVWRPETYNHPEGRKFLGLGDK